MKKTKLGTALVAALCAASPLIAADSALLEVVGQTTRKTKPAELKAKLLACDADLDPKKLDAVVDSMLDVEQDPQPHSTPLGAADNSPADKVRAMLAGKVDDSIIAEIVALLTPAAADADFDADKMDKEDVKAAMDAYGEKLRKELHDAEAARRDVRAVVGDILGMDSAAEVYGFALDHMKVDRKDVEGVPALRALFKAASTNKAPVAPTLAQDAAGMAKRFPNADRFRQA